MSLPHVEDILNSGDPVYLEELSRGLLRRGYKRPGGPPYFLRGETGQIIIAKEIFIRAITRPQHVDLRLKTSLTQYDFFEALDFPDAVEAMDYIYSCWEIGVTADIRDYVAKREEEE